MRRFLVPFGVALLLLMGALKLAEWTSELWWFTSLGQRDTFVRMMLWRGGAFCVFALAWLVVVGQHARLAWLYSDRWRERLALLGPLHPNSESFDSSLLWSSRLTVGGGAFFAGLAAANRFDTWILAFYGRPSGAVQFQAGSDLSFYLFTLPALAWAWNWFGLALLFTAFSVVFLYLATEVIETGPRFLHITSDVANHLAFLGGLLILWVGLKMGLNLLAAPIVDGFTVRAIHGPYEIRFGDTTRQFFALSSLVAAFSVWFFNRRERNQAAFATFSIWLLAALLIPPLAPSIGRALNLNLAASEDAIISSHIQTTRWAWGLEGSQLGTIKLAPDALESTSPRELVSLDQSASNQALWPAPAMRDALRNQIATEQPYNLQHRLIEQVHLEFNDKGQALYRAVQQDRTAKSATTVTVLEASATQPGQVQVLSRETITDVFMHETAGAESLASASIPPLSAGDLSAPTPPWREAVDSSTAIARDTFLNGLVLAGHFSQPSLLAPGQPISWRLTPLARAVALMPVVNWNQSSARPVVTRSGIRPRLYYLMDGVITSTSYPNSASLSTNDSWDGVNYLRQNIVAVCDATTGATAFYILDPSEPFTQVWQQAFPQLLNSVDKLPRDLRAHLRPSPGVLNATAVVAARYHPVKNQTEAESWKPQNDDWQTLLNDGPTVSPWRAVVANQDGKSVPAFGCAFEPRSHSASRPPLQAFALIFDRGENFISQQGRAQWKFFTAPKVLTFPRLGHAEPLSPDKIELLQTTFWPKIQTNQVVGLTVASSRATGATEPVDESQRTSLRGQKRVWQLNSVLISTEASNFSRVENKASAEVLKSLRSLWDNLRKARQNGNWDEVGRLEKTIENTLGLAERGFKRAE